MSKITKALFFLTALSIAGIAHAAPLNIRRFDDFYVILGIVNTTTTTTAATPAGGNLEGTYTAGNSNHGPSDKAAISTWTLQVALPNIYNNAPQ